MLWLTGFGGSGASMESLSFAFFLIFAGAAVLATLALYSRQPLIMAYIVLGMLIGPYGFSLVTDVAALKG
ncbi:MAG TPA: hypothetical protein VFM34_01345, partial [Moraxellaceae bacterium]|nr:hypothetical protein [Moraxellaceae bacterium]